MSDQWVEAEIEDSSNSNKRKKDKKDKKDKKEKKDKKKDKSHKKSKRDNSDNENDKQTTIEQPKEEIKRDSWMTLPTANDNEDNGKSLGGKSWLQQFSGKSNQEKQSERDKKRERDEHLSKLLANSSGLVKNLESLKDQKSNTATTDTTTASTTSTTSTNAYLVGDGGASWRAKKLLRSKQQANEKGLDLDKVLKERFDDQEVKKIESTPISRHSNHHQHHQNRSKEPTKDYLKNEDNDISHQMKKPSENSQYHWSNKSSSSNRSNYNDRDRDYRDIDRDRSNRDYRDKDRDRDRSDRDYRDRDRDRNDRDYRDKDRGDRDSRSDRDYRDSRNDKDNYKKEEKEEIKEKPKQEVKKIEVVRTEQPKLSDYVKSNNNDEIKKPTTTTTTTNTSPPPPPLPQSTITTTTTTTNSNTTVNKLSGELMKAKIMGDKDKIKKLEKQIEELKASQSIKSTLVEEASSSSNKLSGLDQYGNKIFLNEKNHIQPKKQSQQEEQKLDPRIKERFDLKKGEKEQKQYYHDDNDYDLDTLVSMEKKQSLHSKESSKEMDYEFLKTISKSEQWVKDDNEDYGPEFDSSSTKQLSEKKRLESQEKDIKRFKERIVQSDRIVSNLLDKCWFCQSNKQFPKHMVIASGTSVYLQLPTRGSLVPGHCQIVPSAHLCSCVETDEDQWDEIQNFKKCLIQMWATQDKYPLFIETAMKFKQQHHTVIDCIPLSSKLFSDAPGYFKKSLIESESEWAPHKLIDTIKKGGLKNSIPKGFPYLWVEFGYKQIGYLHPIDNEMEFQRDFGKSVIIGMLELDLDQVMNRRRSKSDEDYLVDQFKKKFNPFDWTKQLYED